MRLFLRAPTWAWVACVLGAACSNRGSGAIGGGRDAEVDSDTGTDGEVDVQNRPESRDECGNGMDDDRDGVIDEDCMCIEGEVQSCFTADYPSRHVGICADGLQSCWVGAEGEFGSWGECVGDVVPADQESCDGVDDDCDGATDEECECTASQMRTCGEEFGEIGPCQAGSQTCGEDGTWGDCVGAVGPAAEACDDDLDNDCDGETDEGCGCVPEPEVCADDVDNDCDGDVDECCAEEACDDDLDNDCDGETDEGCAPACPEPAVDSPAGWVDQFGSSDGNIWLIGFDVDPCGSVFLAGTVRAATDFDPGTGTAILTPTDVQDGFLAKYDRDGKFLWVRQFASTAPSGEQLAFVYAAGLAAGPDGEVFIAGRALGSYDLDDSSDATDALVITDNTWDILVAKFDADGTFLWRRLVGMPRGWGEGAAIDVDSGGAAYVTGYYAGETDFDSSTMREDDVLPAPSTLASHDGFVAKWDAGGNLVWVRQLKSDNVVEGTAVAVDRARDVVYLGGYLGSYAGRATEFIGGTGSVSAMALGTNNHFLAKASLDGEFEWAVGFGVEADTGPGMVPAYPRIAVDGDGAVIVSGGFLSTNVFNIGTGSATLTSTGAIDGYIIKIDSAANLVWAQQLGGAGGDGPRGSVGVTRDGRAFVAGIFNGTATFGLEAGAPSRTARGGSDGFVLGLGPDGGVVSLDVWAGSGGDSAGLGTRVSADGYLYSGGQFYGSTLPLTVGGSSRTLSRISSGGSYPADSFLVKIRSLL